MLTLNNVLLDFGIVCSYTERTFGLSLSIYCPDPCCNFIISFWF